MTNNKSVILTIFENKTRLVYETKLVF